MKELLSVVIWIAILWDPLLTNGSPLQSDIKRQSSDNSFTTPAIMKEIESLLGINEHALCVHNFKTS